MTNKTSLGWSTVNAFNFLDLQAVRYSSLLVAGHTYIPSGLFSTLANYITEQDNRRILHLPVYW